MNFLNPALLFGLFAASIPLILHLLNLRKQKKVEFSTLRFLKELQRSKIRRIKIKQILLLILRTLIIIFIVMAFARPTIESSLPYFTSYSNTSAVIIMDNSFSIDASDEFGNRFRQAKQITNSIIDQLGEGDELAYISLSSDKLYDASLTRDFAQIKEQITAEQITKEKTKFKTAFEQANRLLANSINLNKDIYLITDAQNNTMSEFSNSAANSNLNSDSDPVIKEKLGLIIAKLGRDSDYQFKNYSIDSLRMITQIYVKNNVVEVELGVKNNSNQDIDGLIVSLSFNDERTAQQSIDIQSGKTNYFSIMAPVKQSGIISGKVTIESDDIDHDNTRHFAFIVPKPPKIALIQDKDDLFIDVLLNKISDNNFEMKKYKSSQTGSMNLSDYDNIYLINGDYSKSFLTRLKNYMNAGGNIFAFAKSSEHDNKSYIDYQSFMKNIGLNLDKEIIFPFENPLQISKIDKFHKLFDGVFQGSTDENKIVASPNIFIFNPPLNNGRTLIHTNAGAFLSEVRFGEGKLLYCSVGSELDWSSFPLTGLYPSMLYKSIFYLSSGATPSVFANPGDKVVLTIPKNKSWDNKFKIIDPNGKEFFSQAVKLASGNILSFDNLYITGVYQIFNSQGEGVSSIAVNHFKDESETIFYSDEAYKNELKKIFYNKNAPIEFIDNLDDINTAISRAKLGTELWKIFVILAILTALLEMFVAKVSKNELMS